MGFSASFSMISKTCLFLLILFASSASSSPIKDLYDDHCDSIVPRATQTKIDFTDFPLTLLHGNIYYKGGDKIFKRSPKYLYQYPKDLTIKPTGNVYQTDVSGVFKFEASLIFRSTVFYSSTSNDPNSKNRGNVAFKLHGFWSDSSGKLCMVGTGSGYSEEGKLLNLEAVLKLNYVKKSNIHTSLVNGTLESLKLENDENYFDPISILTFPSMKSYYYTFASEKSGHSECASGGLDVLKDSLRGLTTSGDGVCSMFFQWQQTFQLDYAYECKNSKGNCNPLGGNAESVPQYMSTQVIQCSEDKQRLRFLLYFSNGSYGAYDRLFDPNTALVGEGLWDGEKNQLCVVACRILATEGSLANASVGDCYYRLSFRFPAKMSITETSFIQGQIWSNKKVGDSGYFDKIKYRSHDHGFYGVETPELKYEYTKMERVKKLCPPNKEMKKKGSTYPEPLSYQMGVSMSIESSKVKNMWGNAVPLFVGNSFYEQGSHSVIANLETSAAIQNGRLNVCYKIRLSLPLGTDLGGGLSAPSSSSGIYPKFLISAEGIYDIETGDLCMVGCRELNSSMQISLNQTMDCEIVFKLKFPPSNSRRASDITGTMTSSRQKSDPLYFEGLKISSNAYGMYQSQRSIWRMDMEIAMVLISNTLAFVFVALQIFYARKHRESLPYISLVMLVVLALGHLIPLVLNFEALFMKHGYPRRFRLEREGWLQMNEVFLRVVTMIALFLLLRLLQLTWTARSTDPNQKGLWVSDKKAFYVCLPLYLAGGVIVLMVHSISSQYGSAERSSSRVISDHLAQHSLWDDLKSYAGLVLDGFLLPQILLNMFFNSKEAALSRFFYMGTTAVRLLPHGYDLYRAYNYVTRYDGSYYYADHGADYYSTAWNIIIPCGGLAFAIIIFLQQKFGGRYILPRRFREYQEYEKVPVVSEG